MDDVFQVVGGLARIRGISLVSSGDPIIHMWITQIRSVRELLGPPFFWAAIKSNCLTVTFFATVTRRSHLARSLYLPSLVGEGCCSAAVVS